MIRFLNVYYPTRTVILLFCEALIVSGCFLLATVALLGVGNASLALTYEQGYLKITAITAVSLIFSYYFDLYEPQIVSAPLEIYFRILLVLGFDCFLLSILILFFPSIAIAPYVYALAFLLLTPALIGWRRVYDWIVGKNLFRERVYVLGAGDYASSIVSSLSIRRELGMEVMDWQDIRTLEKPARKQIWVNELARIAERKPAIHRIIVAIEDARDELPVQDLLNLRFTGINVENANDLHERLSGKIQLRSIRPSNFLYSDGFRINRSQQFIRQLLSMIVASIGLLLFLPFFPFVVLMIRLTSKGPIFFRQTRVGAGNKNFYVYKFRSMFVDAESGGARWATKNDPRVTRFGMLMRKTRIDELPQLWNVLRGDMSFVGPRPERPEFVPMLSEHLPFYYLRHLVRPGLTGWAQVRFGYGATLEETREKLEYDLYYIKHMSLGLDLLIMFETVKTILRRRGAQ
ncbi:MAG: sugar transferase [Janthinobacterium lividum]